jgi:DNA helicase MCM8
LQWSGAVFQVPTFFFFFVGQLFTTDWNAKSDDLKRRVVVPRSDPIQIHISGFRPLTPFRALKSNALGQFVTVRGTVVRVSGVRPIVRRMNFECAKCGEIETVALVDGKYQAPLKCDACKTKTMVAKRTDADSVDWQNICLQEIIENRSSGRVPRTLECEATGAMVDRCVPGDIVCVSGTVKMVAADDNEKAGGRDNAKNSMYVIYVDANFVDNAHITDDAADKLAEKSDIVEFTAKELAGIRAIIQHPSPMNLLVNSLCPAIWGHELVKLGLCLALVGGVSKHSQSRDLMPLRGDIHVLVVGDPGLGKSQMLRAVNAVSPRGVYVSGGYSSTAGLTVTVLKEKGSGDFVLEAGALVLGDQGIAAIDEFDKMRPQHAALLEAMEQQMISVAKAGIACSLPARTSVIAAANPVGGHFDRAKTVADNLEMAAPMLSRFDMIFLLLDRADATHDLLLSEHIMNIHGDAKSSVAAAARRRCCCCCCCCCTTAAGDGGAQASLRDRLLVPTPFNGLPPALMRKYICYVRRYVRPVLSAGAAAVVKDCFLRLRAESARAGADAIPVTTRTLEALVRLAEARAKLEGREQVTVADAHDVVELFEQTLPVHANAADSFRSVGGRRRRHVPGRRGGRVGGAAAACGAGERPEAVRAERAHVRAAAGPARVHDQRAALDGDRRPVCDSAGRLCGVAGPAECARRVSEAAQRRDAPSRVASAVSPPAALLLFNQSESNVNRFKNGDCLR